MGRRFDPRNRMQLDGENLPIPEEEIPTIEAVPATPEDTDMMDEEVAAEPISVQPMPVEPMPVEPMPVEPETEKPVNKTESALAIPVPSASTVALEAAKSPEEDEYETMMKDYAQAQKNYGTEYEKLMTEGEEESRRDRMLSGVAGLVQSFGEGLSAITGSSTKPLQTATESIRRMGEMRAAERGEKAKTLKERLMQKRAPIEAKMEETKFRDVFEQRQKAKRLEDPASPESKQARELANNFLDAYISSVANRTDETQLARIEGIRPRLENLSANQIKDFVDNLNKLKFTESRTDIEELKAERRLDLERIKADISGKKTKETQDIKSLVAAEKDYKKDIDTILQERNSGQDFIDRISSFESQLKSALTGNKDALKYIQANKNVLAYVLARKEESKGVFTDQDFAMLNALLSNETWAAKMNAWLTGGLEGEPPKEQVELLLNNLSQMKKNWKSPREAFIQAVKAKRESYLSSEQPAYQRQADKLSKYLPKITIDGKDFEEGDTLDVANPNYPDKGKMPHRVKMDPNTNKLILVPVE